MKDLIKGKLSRAHTILVVESGSDLPPKMAQRLGIHILPMHVSIGGENLNDGDFPISRIFEYHRSTKKTATTSATVPHEYRELFLRLHREQPAAKILHLCYSAVTTSSWNNALLGSEGLNYITHVDTKQVSGGFATVALAVAGVLQKNPHMPIAQLAAWAKRIAANTKFVFLPNNLEYLRAGGRVSNTAYLGGSILGIKPLIEIQEGKLVCTKKYRGKMAIVSKRVIEDLLSKHNFEKDSLFFMCGDSLTEEDRKDAERIAQKHSYPKVRWFEPGGVISCHSGPGAFGMGGILAAAL